MIWEDSEVFGIKYRKYSYVLICNKTKDLKDCKIKTFNID